MTTPEHLLELGLAWYRRGHLVEATELLDAARRTAEVLNEPRVAAEAWLNYARLTSLSCEPKLAEDAFCHAAALFESLGERGRGTDARVRQAFVAYDAGDLDRANELLERELEGAGDPSVVRGMAAGYIGNIARSRSQFSEARGHYRAAIDMLSALQEKLFRAVFEMDLAITALLERSFDEAWQHLQAARRVASEAPGEPMLAALLAHYEALALVGLGEGELARSALGRFEHLPSEAMDYLASTHPLFEYLLDAPKPRVASRLLQELRTNMPAFEHARLTTRILRGLLGGSTSRVDRLTVVSAEHRVRVGSDLEADFVADSAEWRILLALAAHRQAAKTEALAPDALVEAGWPAEKIAADSAKNRLHVALSKLRKRGLRDLLLRYPSGYALSPGLSIVLVQSETE